MNYELYYVKAKCHNVGIRLKYLQEYQTAYKDITFIYIGNSRIDNKPMFKISNNTGYDIILDRNYTIWDDKYNAFILSNVELINTLTNCATPIKKEKFNKYKHFDI